MELIHNIGLFIVIDGIKPVLCMARQTHYVRWEIKIKRLT